MAYHPKEKLVGRQRRKVRVRKKIFGTAECPRLTVFRSAKHVYAQVVDDEKGTTLAAVSSVAKGVTLVGDKSAVAKQVGEALGKVCGEKNIKQVVFDRNGYRFHGRVKAVADGARESGLEF